MLMYNRGFLTCVLFFFCSFSFSQNLLSPERVVQRNLDCYNRRDLDGFISSFSDSSEILRYGEAEPVAKGIDDIRRMYKELFETSPNLHSTIACRTQIGNKIIDHELITGRHGNDQVLELLLIYEIENELIKRITIIK